MEENSPLFSKYGYLDFSKTTSLFQSDLIGSHRKLSTDNLASKIDSNIRGYWNLHLNSSTIISNFPLINQPGQADSKNIAYSALKVLTSGKGASVVSEM
jgi:hypothetical protein